MDEERKADLQVKERLAEEEGGLHMSAAVGSCGSRHACLKVASDRTACEPEGPRFDSASALLSSKVVVYGHGLVTLSLTVIAETLKWLSSLPILCRSHSCDDSVSDRYVIINLPLPPPP